MEYSFEILNQIVRRIDVDPITVGLVKKMEEIDSGVRVCLSDTELLDQLPAAYNELIGELSLQLDGLMITKNGQCSSAFYSAHRNGYRLRVAESDSFGPLSCLFEPNDTKWKYYYG